MSLQYGPKIRTLTTTETLATIEAWKSNVLYSLSQNPDFKEFLVAGFIWGKKTRANPHRDFVDIYTNQTIPDPEDSTKTKDVLVKDVSKESRCAVVDLLLEQIANYSPQVPRTDITKDCRSMKEVWVTIRSFYNKQQTGASLNDTWNVHRELDETPQALYGRLKQIYIDSLLTTDGLFHNEGRVSEDEELSPTLQNTIILHWLQIMHPSLRDLVTQRFIIQLRDHTYAAIFPEISRSVDHLLEELNSTSSVNKVSYSQNPRAVYQNKAFQRPNYSSTSYKPSYQAKESYQKSNYSSSSNRSTPQSSNKLCQFCKLTGKRMFHTHNIEDCFFVKRLNSQSSIAVHQVAQEKDDWELQCEEFNEYTGEEVLMPIEHILNYVKSDASPVLELQYKNQPCLVTLDTGAPCNLIKTAKAEQLKAPIKDTTQRVRMADGVTYLDVVGETEITLYRNNKPYHLPAIVCNDTDTDILAGVPFMKSNDVAIRPFNDEIILGGKEFVKYNPTGSS